MSTFHYRVHFRFTGASGREIPDREFRMQVDRDAEFQAGEDSPAVSALLDRIHGHIAPHFPGRNVEPVLDAWRELVVYDGTTEVGRGDLYTAVVP